MHYKKPTPMIFQRIFIIVSNTLIPTIKREEDFRFM